MQRSDIPAALARDRAADVARIPLAALKSMNPDELRFRLDAVSEFRRRRGQHGLPAEDARMYSDLASETLTATSPGRVATLLKSAGVASYTLRDGTKVPTGDEHELKAAVDIGKRDHRSGRPGDDAGFRQHLINRAKALNMRQAIPASWASGAGVAGKSALSKAARIDQSPAMARARRRLAEIQRTSPARAPAAAPAHAGPRAPVYEPLAKAAEPAKPGRSVTVPTPALDVFDHVGSFTEGLNKLLSEGSVGLAAKEMASLATAADELRGGPGTASYYAAKALQMTNPADRRGYEELARRAREKAGAA